MKRIAVLASGSGSNAENLVRYFSNSLVARVVWMACDRKDAFVFERMKQLGIASYYISRSDFENGNLLRELKAQQIDFIVLAGFLRLVPGDIIRAFHGRIVNIHPALLPKFGGKGMFGMHVHNAVIDAGEKLSGITIHFVNEHFDEGEIIAQYTTPVTSDDSPGSLAAKIHSLEMKYYPHEVEQLLMKVVKRED